MGQPVLIIGKSGSGKSRSIINCDPATTMIINVIGKTLPFKGWAGKYTPIDKEGKGNMVVCDAPEKVKSALVWCDQKRPDIKTLIIDDFQYVMVNEFMRRSSEKGYDKFSEIANHAWDIIWQSKLCRQDLIVIFLSHSESSESGETKIKTIGLMLDEKVCLEGMFTIVLEAVNQDGKYYFSTQTNGKNTIKSPEGMFTDLLIPNDLKLVIDSINIYDKGE